MGWVGCNKPKGMTMDDFFDKEFTCEFVGKGALVNFSEYYRAFKAKDGTIKAIVCLVRMGKGDFNLYFKSMDSDMGPFAYRCPKTILDRITPPRNEWGKKWFDKCVEYQKLQNEIKNIQDGDLIIFDNEIPFSNGNKYKTFICKKEKVNGRQQLVLYTTTNGKPNHKVKFKGWKSLDFKIQKAM